ncbi:uncharacterized protein PHACADRAFT_214913 [Phanerochaete carnosa HHB-10118-sp]|uniref:DUF6533 domain-containing protein n=1 Tax=Phanerochaete carnosa (strain HHB-10118-sp) TaxID=650164 RepID=K5VNL8_PHACS|nr:uncharacterized protein PHACADRAFT_214913 [Phanerochaete carnosa HHB-10118-sp]EKM48194.1 hypothetical protein PHACADRAFT_214913 [Phanerochaete carnosa HHB-10118-sp]
MDADPNYVEEVYESIVSSEISYGVLALVVYEYLITFDQEVAIVWRRKITLTSAFLVILRWAMVVNAIIANIVPSTDLGCKIANRLENVVIWIGYGGTALFSALRVSAIWGRNWFLFVLVLALGSIPVWANIYTAARSQYDYTEKFGGCWQNIYYSDKAVTVIRRLHLSTRISLIAMDFLVLILTWAKTFSQWRESRRLRIPKSIAGSLLRDGTIYFLLLLCINLAQILTYNLMFAPVNLLIAVMPLRAQPGANYKQPKPLVF